MKTTKLILLIVTSVILLGSCAHSIFPAQSLYDNYNSQMKSEEELSIKAKVNIYFFEKDIKSDCEIISLNTYKPFCLLPFQSIFVKKMTKRFLKEAVLKAYEEGGNAILVNIGRNGGQFYVLNLKDWEADDAIAATFVNPILNMKLAEEIKSGSLLQKKRNERVRKEKAFVEEIETNVDNIESLEEVRAVREKINILSEYNSSLKHPQKSYEKAVKKYTKKCDRIEKKLNKSAAKVHVKNDSIQKEVIIKENDKKVEKYQEKRVKNEEKKAAKEKEQEMLREKDMYYIAYLLKTHSFNQEYKQEMMLQYNVFQIEELYKTYSEEELLELSVGRSKKVEKYRK